ncbi:MAG: hypothetical protein KGZ51_05630 [Erysipelothrix sp.]|jgi:hypothetical protein|nr:hypothetical protein [Erysipelothrix sp.]
MKKSKLLLVSWVLSAIYVVYLVSYFSSVFSGSTGSEQVGVGLAGIIIFPHALATFIGLIFNFFGWSMHKRGFALTGAILYSVAMFLFPIYFFFIIIQTVISYVAFAKMKPTTSSSTSVVTG